MILFAIILITIGLSFIMPIVINQTPPIPSSNKTINDVIKYINKYDKNGKDILEIGSGYGFSTFKLSNAFQNKKIIAYEISLIPFVFSSLIRILFRYKNVTIIYGDAFKILKEKQEMYSSAFVYCMQTGAMSEDLEHILKNNIKEILIVSTYPLKNIAHIAKSENIGFFHSKLYIYKN